MLECLLDHVKNFGLYSKCLGKPLEQVMMGWDLIDAIKGTLLLETRLTGGRVIREKRARMDQVVQLGYFSSPNER